MSPIHDNIQELKMLAAKLNKASDAAADIIADLEQRLEATGIGITYWLPAIINKEYQSSGETDLGEPAEYSLGYQIGWDKVGKKWHLAYRVTEIEEYGDDFGPRRRPDAMRISEHRTPFSPEVLVNSPRSVRVQAVRLLDDLVTGLTTEAESLLRAVESKAVPATSSTSEIGDSADQDEV